MTGVAERRDTVVGGIVAAFALAWMCLVATEGNGRWPWAGFVIVAAAAYLLLALPPVRGPLRTLVAGRVTRVIGAVAAVAAGGAALTIASGVSPWWDAALWPVAFGIALAAVDTDATGEPPPGRLLLAAVAIAILAGRFDWRLQVRAPGGLDFGLQWFAALDMMLFLVLVVRPLRTFDVGFGLRGRDLGAALLAVAALVFIALPVGYITGFLHFNVRWNGLGYAAGRLVGLTLFVGLAEEMFFRGIVQEAFTRLWGARTGWLTASVVFGLTHIVKHAPPLNWRYALLATIAGLAYGWVYQRTRKLAAAAVTHGLVDWIWGTFLLVP